MRHQLLSQVTACIQANDFKQAINVLEAELARYSDTPFYKIIGLDLLNISDDFGEYANAFVLNRRNKGVETIFCEMNAFSINHDSWHVDLYGYDFLGGTEDISWISNWKYQSNPWKPFLIKGYEEIQLIYKEYMEKESYDDRYLNEAENLCHTLVLLRFQEAIYESLKEAIIGAEEWGKRAVFATVHDYYSGGYLAFMKPNVQ